MNFKKLLRGAAIAGGLLVAARGLDERLETTHYIIKSDTLPEEFDGYRIVQISDLHASVIPGLTEEIASESPDIIVSTGDLVHDKHSYEPGILLMERLVRIAPVYAVTGNHDLRRADYDKFQRELDATGVITLHDESVRLTRDGADITLSGIEDPFTIDGGKIEQRIHDSINALPRTDKYHIVLFHRANHLDLLKRCGYDLILAGHMHGGQVRLPNGRGVCAPKSSWGSGTSVLFPKYFAGRSCYGKTNMIVNRGIGNPMIIPRLFNRPEITVVILRRKRGEK